MSCFHKRILSLSPYYSSSLTNTITEVIPPPTSGQLGPQSLKLLRVPEKFHQLLHLVFCLLNALDIIKCVTFLTGVRPELLCHLLSYEKEREEEGRGGRKEREGGIEEKGGKEGGK